MTLRGDKYETAEEVKFRLEGTVVLYDGQPVYITRTGARGDGDEGNEFDRVWFRPLPYKPETKEVRKLLSSKHFDLSPFRMGYFNHNGRALFVERSPQRQNKQGLSNANTAIRDLNQEGKKAIGFVDLIGSQGFVDMCNNKFPSLQEAHKMFKEGALSVALSRRFCVVNDQDLGLMYVSHKGLKCGLILPDEGVRLSVKHNYLRESLIEDNIRLQ